MIRYIDNIRFETVWDYGIRLIINKNSNMERVFVSLKILSSSELLASSVYAINHGDGNEVVFNKRNLNFLKRMDFDEFVESWTFNEGGIIYSSGDEPVTAVSGWEFRYEICITREEFEGVINKVITAHLPYA